MIIMIIITNNSNRTMKYSTSIAKLSTISPYSIFLDPPLLSNRS